MKPSRLVTCVNQFPSVKRTGSNSGCFHFDVLSWTSVDLHVACLSVQAPQEDVGPSCHLYWFCVWLFSHFVGLWKCSTGSFQHKGTDMGPTHALLQPCTAVLMEQYASRYLLQTPNSDVKHNTQTFWPHGSVIQEKLEYLCNLIGLQVPVTIGFHCY